MKTRLLFLNQCFDKTRLRNLIAWVLYTKGEKRTIEIVEKLKSLGFQFATRAGISLSVDDLKIPSEKAPLVSQAKQQVALADREYERGSVTSIEKLQQLVDTWHRTSETLKQTVVSNFQATDKLSPVYMMAFSGARGNISQVRQLAGMRGLMADPQGQIIGFPIRSNFREGLTLTEYMISCYGARKGLVDTALRTADAGYLTRRLVDVSQHMVVKASTCATRRGIVLYDLVISGKSALSLRDRLIGRVLAQDVYIPSHLSISQSNEVAMGSDGHIINVDEKGSLLQRPSISQEHVEESTKSLEHFSSLKGQLDSRIASNGKGPLVGRGWPSKPIEKTKTKIGKRNQEISASLASQIASVQKKVSVRSPLTCSIRDGVCQLCYGWSLSEGRLVNLGEAVGIIAAQSIGEPGTQLTMRTFHTGGVFSGDVMTEIRSPYDGTAHFSNPLQGLLIRTSHGKIAFLTKSPGELVIQSNNWVGVSMATPGHRGAPPKSPVSLLEGSTNVFDALHPVDNRQKQVETVFTLAASTVVFIRHHEQVRRAQLIAEFSSMGTEINETIEAKRTLFANTAGQISFASLLIGTQTRGNGDIVRVSRNLGFVWILSGRQPGPAALLELLQKGAHIVNKNTIIARVSAFRENSSLFVNTIDKKIQGMSSGKTIRGKKAIPSLHFLKKIDKALGGAPTPIALQAMQPGGHRTPHPSTHHLPVVVGLSGSLKGGKTNRSLKETTGPLQHYLQSLGEGPRIHDPNVSFPNVSLLFDSRGLKALCARFDFVGTRFVNGDGKQFLPSILYSLMPLTSVDRTKSDRFVIPSALSLALVKRTTKKYGIMAVSSDDRNENWNRALYRSIPSANTPDKGTLLGFKRFLPQEGVGAALSIASNATTHEARLTLDAKRTLAQQPMAKGTADTANHQSQYLRPFPKLSLLNQRSSDSSIGHRSALSIQRHASSYSIPSDNSKQFVSIKKGLNSVKKGLITAVNSDNVMVWVFPTRYKVTKKEMVWFDSRCLSQKLTFGELILIEKNLTSLHHGDSTPTVSPVITSCYKTISAKRRFNEAAHLSQDQTFLPIRVISANPLADRPSISNDKGSWNQDAKRLLSHHLQCIQADTHHSQSLVEGMRPLQAFQNKDNQTSFKACSNGNAVSPFREISNNYSVTSSNFPHLFAKASKINKFSFVNTRRGALDGLCIAGNATGWPSKVGSPCNKPTTQKRLSQRNKVTATKSWIVNFENTYSFTKKKALKMQSEHFFHQTQKNVPLGSRFDGHPVALPAMQRPYPFSLQNVKKVPFPKKHSSFWVYCPQEIYKVSVLHESVDLYRNWQFDNLCFDSSFIHIKGLFSSELLYRVKNNLDPIVSKLFLFSKKDTTFSQLCQPTGLLITQPLRTEMGSRRTISLQPYPNVFVWTSQPQNTLSGSNRQYLSVYHTYLQIQSSEAGKPLKDSALSSVKKRDFVGNVEKSKLCEKKFLLHFTGPNMVDSLKHQKGMAMEPLGVGGPKKDTSLPLLKKSSFQESKNVSFKRGVLFFLRKWMQIPQSCALHEGVTYLNKWGNASSLSKVLQIEQLGFDHHPVALPAMQRPTKGWTTTQTVKISAPCHGHKGFKVFFDTHSCFQSAQLNQKLNDTGIKSSHLQRDDRTKRYRFLVWKNLMNCKPFLLLRACPLQVQIVSNTKARNFLPICVAHPLNWQSLVHASDLRKENLQEDSATSRRAWYKTLKEQLEVNGTYNKSTKAPKGVKNLRFEKPERLTSFTSGREALNAQDLKNNSLLLVKESMYKLNLRQRLGFGPLPLKDQGAKSFFDSISNLEKKALTNHVNNLSQVSDNLPITEVQQREICWPYSSQPTIFAAASKGCSILLPSITVLTTSHNSQSNFVATEKEGALVGTGFINSLQGVRGIKDSVGDIRDGVGGAFSIARNAITRKSVPWTLSTKEPKGGSLSALSGRGPKRQTPYHLRCLHDPMNPKRGKREITKLYTSPFRFVRKVKKTLLVTNCKPSYLSLMPLLLSKDFCTRVVSNESYLIRFFGNVSSSLTSLRSIDSTVCDDSATYVSSNHQLSPATGEIVSQDTDFRLSESGRLLSQSTPSPLIDDEMLKPLLGSGPLQPTPSLVERRGLSYVKSLSHQGIYSNTVLLTEGDQLSMSFSEEKTNVSVGQFVTLGEEVVPGYAALVSGQVVAVELNKVTLRRSQALLFYAQGVTHVNHGQWVNKNAPILTLTYQKLVTGDIVQGIPKIEQFFEAPATREGEPLGNSLQLRLRKTYQRLKSLLPLAEAVKQSLEEIQQVLVEGILRVYLSQGVRIADKHLEIVIRQMTSKGQILDVGDTGLFQGEFVNLNRIERINLGTYGQKADYEPSVLGITQASLGSESFISAASFQETTRVLSRDTIVGKTDFLRGLKERVVLGDVIQAGTGLDDNINYGLLFGVTSS